MLRWVLRVALPIGGAAAMLHLFPYHATAAGVHFRVEGSLVTRSGFSASTTFGNWEFPHVDGLPLGVRISPENVDVVELASQASRNGALYVDTLQHDLDRQVPRMILWLVGETLIGVLLGLAVAVAVNLAVRYLRGLPRRPREWWLRLEQLGGVVAVLALIAGYGAATYNPNWVRESRTTGTLGALQLFPGDLAQYYTQQSKFFDVVSAIAGIQAQLQVRVEQTDVEPSAFNIMFVSDMHLASSYPLVAQYAQNFDVSLIVNTGDESEFGTRQEMTTDYLNQLRALTRKVPMVWLAGNHDSPATVDVMRSIPGVTVLGTKTQQVDGSYQVSGQVLDVLGLTIAAVPDPRVYGGGGDYGSNDDKVTRALEERAMDDASRDANRDARYDIVASHEPVASARLARDLGTHVRQTVAGHLHAQNPQGDIESNGRITLVEGSTGAGGLDNINRGVPPPPVEFSIESVSNTCQFTKVVRFQIQGPLPSRGEPPSTGQQVTASTRYLDPQQIESGRRCDAGAAAGPVRPLATG
ncbi:MAG: hypothetical protein QOE97_2631 [Pseudonocardiales bacterium]|nr:hypothetical protein [Pseudonocardiales bacterium]